MDPELVRQQLEAEAERELEMGLNYIRRTDEDDNLISMEVNFQCVDSQGNDYGRLSVKATEEGDIVLMQDNDVINICEGNIERFVRALEILRDEMGLE